MAGFGWLSRTKYGQFCAWSVSQRVHRCVECPRCHLRYVIGTNPYSNGSYIVSEASTEIALSRLFCACSVSNYYEFRLGQLKAYVVSPSIHERGYGSAEIVERRRQHQSLTCSCLLTSQRHTEGQVPNSQTDFFVAAWVLSSRSFNASRSSSISRSSFSRSVSFNARAAIS